ncbi:MAG: hypothetical protein KDB00_05520 [Planctomycetales bacterium]|nr:hypothetical protein [Planctomycetales bacterium]
MHSVVYDTSVPAVIPASYQSAGEQSASYEAMGPVEPAGVEKSAPVSETRRSRMSIGDGFRAVAGLLAYGLFKVVDVCLGGDGDEYDPTPRGADDRDFNRWINSRDRWQRSDPGR